MRFEPLDFFNIDDGFTPEDIQIRDTVRDFVEKEIRPHIAAWWEDGVFPRELPGKLARLGLLGSFVPEKYGGAGCSHTTYGIICRELERGDSGIRSFVSVQSSLVMFPILTFGSEQQKKQYLPRLASAELIGCYGLTEPDAGSDPGSMTTRARRDGNHWILQGSKMWITNGSIADIAIVWARDDDGRVRGFILHKGDKGFSAPEIKHKVSLRASVTSELVFDDVRVPAEREFPRTEGLKSPLMCLTSARYGIAWGAVGALQALFNEARQYTRERSQFGRPLAGFQLTQDKLVNIATELTRSQLMARQLGYLADSGRLRFDRVSMAKRSNVAAALQAARTVRAMLGAGGITLEHDVIRHMCNLESVHTYEGTYEIHTLILGEQLTGISAFGSD